MYMPHLPASCRSRSRLYNASPPVPNNPHNPRKRHVIGPSTCVFFPPALLVLACFGLALHICRTPSLRKYVRADAVAAYCTLLCIISPALFDQRFLCNSAINLPLVPTQLHTDLHNANSITTYTCLHTAALVRHLINVSDRDLYKRAQDCSLLSSSHVACFCWLLNLAKHKLLPSMLVTSVSQLCTPMCRRRESSTQLPSVVHRTLHESL